MTSKEAIKRLRQETVPATYNQDFDKEECCDIIEEAIRKAEAYDTLIKQIQVWHDLLLKSGIDSKGLVLFEIESLIENELMEAEKDERNR